MTRYVVTYSYPTTDRYYRGQRTTAVDAKTEQAARKAVLAEAPQGARVIRVKSR